MGSHSQLILVVKMFLILTGFFIFISPCFSQNIRLARNTNQLQSQVANLQSTVSALQTNVRAVQRTTVTASIRTNEVRAVADYVLSSTTQCGPRIMTGWIEKLDFFSDQAVSGGAASATNQFNSGTGIFTPQHNGYYHICSYSRFKLGGNSVEMCLRKGGSRVACYGNAVQYDWRSTGVCTIQSLTTTDTVDLYLESGGGSDCVEETGWSYNQISFKLIQTTSA